MPTLLQDGISLSSDRITVGGVTLYKGGSWPTPVIPYDDDNEEDAWDTLCRGYGPIPPQDFEVND
jgi:hypothetical protein